MSQKKSLHDLTNGLIQNGMEDYDSCVMLAVKGEKAVFAAAFRAARIISAPAAFGWPWPCMTF